MSEQKKQSLQRRKRVFDIIETGAASDWVSRGRENIVPRGDIVLNSNDVLILGAEALKDDIHIELKEVVLLKHNPWRESCHPLQPGIHCQPEPDFGLNAAIKKEPLSFRTAAFLRFSG